MANANDAWNAWIAADNAWHAEIEKAYPRQHAGDIRYTALGKGKPGTALRAAHDLFISTGDAWRALRDGDLVTISI
jgi:hypothetical protein